MTDRNTNMERLIEMLKSSEASIRYEACEYLRVAPVLSSDAVKALEHMMNDPESDVADAAQRALALHAPKLDPDLANVELQKETGDNPQANANWIMIKAGTGAIVSTLVTTAAANYFKQGCTNSNYTGNLFFIFIVTWISWMLISSLSRGNVPSVNLRGMFLSLFVILLGALPCIALIGFWIAPVCN